MKIEELSIGDWVRHTFYEENVQIVRIYGDGERVLAERGKLSISCHLNHFEPIPLTPEILEKNGFTLCNGCTSRWGLEYGAYWFRVTAPDDYADVTIYKKVAHGYRRVMDEWEITAVHQLQHVLRLAGLEKEIEL